MNPAPLRAAIYARVSTEMQSRASIDDQIRKCSQYADSHGLKVLEDHVYRDENRSGTGMDRPSVQRLLQSAEHKEKQFDVILVDDQSRLSRRTENILSICRRLEFADVQLISVSQGFNSHQDQAETLFTIHGLIDSSYVRELAKKTHRGLEGCVLRDLSAGGRCFGYDTIPVGTGTSKRYVVNENEAVIVRRLFEMSASGYSFRSIARTFNEEHAAGRGDWCPTGIRAMLKREIYKGEVVWNRTKFVKVPETNRRVARPRDETEWIRRERPDLAIVSIELWNRVQCRLGALGHKASEGRRRGLFPRALTSPYLFSGRLKCGECGGNMIIGTGGGTHVHKKYVCANYFNRGTCENDLYIRLDILEQRLLGRLQSELLRPEVIDYAIGEFGRQLRTALAGLSGDVANLRRQKERLESEIQRFADAIARGGPLDSLVQQIAKREMEVKAITNRLLSTGENSLDTRLREIRQFVTLGISDLRSLLGRDAALAKAELHSHLSEIRMTPTEDGKNWHYVAEGSWNLLGTGPSAPAFGLAHSDGCGGWI
jgi:site-specific DNA recombinase